MAYLRAFTVSWLALCLLAPTIRARAQTAAGESVARVESLVQGLETPWAISFAPDGRIFLSERPGRIRVVLNGKLRAEPWMTLPVAETGEAGLLGIALDPNFAANRFVYAAYTYRRNGRLLNRLARLRDGQARGTFDRALLDGVPGARFHDGGRVKFGPDGKLYWTVGDALEAELSQSISSLNGKILRLNPDGTIPPDNPFPNSPVYAYGLRNPQGLAWQPGTSRLYATDHGPSGFPGSGRDEVNYIEPGKNYGWPVITGDETRQGMERPVVHSGSFQTWAPSGAVFATRGPWAGALLFAGLRGEALYRLTLDAKDPRKAVALERFFHRRFGRLRDVVEGPDGAIYLLTSNRDGRGSPSPEDDQVLRLVFK